jgi:hypothetical protein
VDEVLQKAGEEYTDVHQYAAELVEKLQRVHQRVKQILQEVNIERNENELLAKMLKLTVGEQVWMFDPTTKTGESKMKVRWMGPYTILEKASSTVYILDVKGHRYSANIERLKKATINDNDNSDENKKDSDTLQLEQLNEELHSMKQMQQTLIHKQKLTELQKEQLSAKIKASTATANQVASEDAEQNEEKYDGEDEISDLSAAIVMHLHSGEVNWNT